MSTIEPLYTLSKVTDVWISQKYGFAYVEMEDQKWVLLFYLFDFNDKSGSQYVPHRTALKAIKELNGTFMCGGTVTVGNLLYDKLKQIIFPPRLRWPNETTRRERRGSWIWTWDGATAKMGRTGTESEIGAEVEAGVRRGHQDCMQPCNTTMF